MKAIILSLFLIFTCNVVFANDISPVHFYMIQLQDKEIKKLNNRIVELELQIEELTKKLNSQKQPEPQPVTRPANDGGPEWIWDNSRRVWFRILPTTPVRRGVLSLPSSNSRTVSC